MIFQLLAPRFKALTTEAGPVKTPVVAAVGWVSSRAVNALALWPYIKSIVEAIILLSTVVIVGLHVLNAVIRQWCPVRRKAKDTCVGCPFYKKTMCWRGTNENDNPL